MAVTAFLIFLADYLTKYAAIYFLSDEPVKILGNFLKFELTFNTGAAFSLATSKTIYLSVFAMAVAAFIFYFARRIDSTKWAIALGLVLGGIFGNLSDRIFRSPGGLQGAVVDWISIPKWPIFNIADSAVVVGVISLVSLIWAQIPPRTVVK
ncbi:MAG: signal peptidase II [Actinobacteria bacterium]|nr:signal peptidase II [Actinomycetota bacterium]